MRQHAANLGVEAHVLRAVQLRDALAPPPARSAPRISQGSHVQIAEVAWLLPWISACIITLNKTRPHSAPR
eukprot:3219000-Rhodomonas_salina.2